MPCVSIYWLCDLSDGHLAYTFSDVYKMALHSDMYWHDLGHFGLCIRLSEKFILPEMN